VGEFVTLFMECGGFPPLSAAIDEAATNSDLLFERKQAAWFM
jgi:hypothetical protein